MNDVNEENKSLDDYINEFKGVISNPDSVDIQQLQNMMQNVYKVGNTINSGNDVEKAKEFSDIVDSLNSIMREKRQKAINATIEKTNEVKENNSDSSSVSKEFSPQKVNMNEPEPLPKQVDITPPSSKEAEIASEAEAKSAISSSEIVHEDDLPKDMKPSRKEWVEFKVIPAPVFENSPEQPKPSTEQNHSDIEKHEEATEKTDKPTEQSQSTKEEIAIETPDTVENIIVSNTDDKTEDKKDESEDVLSDFDDILTVKPFDGDDDLDDIVLEDAPESKEDDTSNNEEFSVETKEDKAKEEEERIKKIEDEYSSIPEDLEIHSIKQVSRVKVSDTLKALTKLNTDNIRLEKLEMYDFDANDENIRRGYLKTRNDMIASPKVSRVSLLMSGHYEEISAYGNYDLTSVQRVIYNNSSNFYERERILYESIYGHVQYVSYSKTKPDFDTWAKNIMYPDIASLFYGVYDANSVGDNNYNFDCPFCYNEVSIARKNKDLTVAVPKELTADKLDKFITTKDVFGLDTVEISKWAKTATVRKKLSKTNIIVDYGIPTLYDYLTMLGTFNRINARDMRNEFDMSIIEGFNVDESNENDFMRMMGYLYIKDIGTPVRVGDTNKFRYIRLKSKADIIEYVNSLNIDDYNELFKGKDVTDIMVKSATRYYLKDCQCPNCKRNIKFVAINPKQIFFFKIGEERNRMS